MIRYYILSVLIGLGVFLCPLLTQSQSRADSLRQALKDAQGKERIEILLDLGSYTRQNDVEKAINEAEEALQISRRLGYPELESKSLRRLGYFHSLLVQNGKALENYLDALKIVRNNNHPLPEAEILYQLGRFYYGQEKYDQALDYYFKSLRIREAEQDNNGAAVTLYYIGVIHGEREDYEQALSFYSQSYNLGQEINNYRQMSMAAAELGIVYQNLDSLDQALDNYNLALEAADHLNSNHAKASILLYMSSVYQDQKLYNKAIELNHKQIEIGRAQNSKAIEAQGLQNLAELYFDQNDLTHAIQYARQARSIYRDLGYPESEIITDNQLAKYLLEQNPSESIDISQAAFENAKSTGMIEERMDALNTMTEAYLQLGKYEQAYQSQARLTALKDSSFNMEQEKQIAELQTRYETDQKEQELVLLQEEHEKGIFIRNAILAGLLLFLIIGLLIYNRQRLKIRKKHTELENNLLKEEKLKKDLDFKNKQLTTHSLNLVQKNETMKELKENINQINRDVSDDNVAKKLLEIEHLIDYSFNLDEDWDEFRLYFEEVHNGFFKKLHAMYPNLTSNEFRLSALVKLQLTIKEIATIMGISPDSVKTARYRLRKKLGMETEENLTDFMMNIEKEASDLSGATA